MNDLISRQAAIDKLAMWGKIPELNGGQRDVIAITIDMLSSLPSVQPERKKGEWIIGANHGLYVHTLTCNQCGHSEVSSGKPNYCSNCGADMIKSALNTIPSVQPKQKKGTWLLFDDCYCSRRGYKLQMTGLPMHCPNCGAYMKD